MGHVCVCLRIVHISAIDGSTVLGWMGWPGSEDKTIAGQSRKKITVTIVMGIIDIMIMEVMVCEEKQGGAGDRKGVCQGRECVDGSVWMGDTFDQRQPELKRQHYRKGKSFKLSLQKKEKKIGIHILYSIQLI